MELNSTDSADMIIAKLCEATNYLGILTQNFIVSGKELREAKIELIKDDNETNEIIFTQKRGKHAENKALIDLQKQIINSLKIQLRAESAGL